MKKQLWMLLLFFSGGINASVPSNTSQEVAKPGTLSSLPKEPNKDDRRWSETYGIPESDMGSSQARVDYENWLKKNHEEVGCQPKPSKE